MPVGNNIKYELTVRGIPYNRLLENGFDPEIIDKVLESNGVKLDSGKTFLKFYPFSYAFSTDKFIGPLQESAILDSLSKAGYCFELAPISASGYVD